MRAGGREGTYRTFFCETGVGARLKVTLAMARAATCSDAEQVGSVCDAELVGV